MNHFSKSVLQALARKGITIVSLTTIPDNTAAMPYACGDTGYVLNDNGTHRVRRYREVLALAEAA